MDLRDFYERYPAMLEMWLKRQRFQAKVVSLAPRLADRTAIPKLVVPTPWFDVFLRSGPTDTGINRSASNDTRHVYDHRSPYVSPGLMELKTELLKEHSTLHDAADVQVTCGHYHLYENPGMPVYAMQQLAGRLNGQVFTSGSEDDDDDDDDDEDDDDDDDDYDDDSIEKLYAVKSTIFQLPNSCLVMTRFRLAASGLPVIPVERAVRLDDFINFWTVFGEMPEAVEFRAAPDTEE